MNPTKFFNLPVEKQRELSEGETAWFLVPESWPEIKMSAEEYDAILFGRTPCPYCDNTFFVEYVEKGHKTGAFRKQMCLCRCDRLRHKLKVLQSILPPKYLEANFATLKPSKFSSSERQEELIEGFRKNPSGSVFMYGRSGTSKTTYACALLRAAVERDWGHFYTNRGLEWGKEAWIWRINFDTLMGQINRKQFEKELAPDPDITVESIKARTKDKRRFVFCIEEVDKTKLTEHRCNKLFDIIDTLYNCNGQLIMTTNLTFEGFENMFTKTDDENVNTTGVPLIRRIKEMCELIAT